MSPHLTIRSLAWARVRFLPLSGPVSKGSVSRLSSPHGPLGPTAFSTPRRPALQVLHPLRDLLPRQPLAPQANDFLLLGEAETARVDQLMNEDHGNQGRKALGQASNTLRSLGAECG